MIFCSPSCSEPPAIAAHSVICRMELFMLAVVKESFVCYVGPYVMGKACVLENLLFEGNRDLYLRTGVLPEFSVLSESQLKS